VRPKSEHCPSRSLKHIGYPLISDMIARQLFLPPVTVSFRDCAVLWATMPKAPVNEYCQLDAREGDIDI